MNWEALGTVAEILSAIAVVATLYYLAIQIRESRLQSLAEDTMTAVDRWLAAQTKVLQTEESVGFMRRALNDYDGLTPEGKGRFHAYMFELFAAYQAVLNFERKGSIDPREFAAIERAYAFHMKCPGATAWWEETKSVGLPEYTAERVDRILAEYSDPPISEVVPYYSRVE